MSGDETSLAHATAFGTDPDQARRREAGTDADPPRTGVEGGRGLGSLP